MENSSSQLLKDLPDFHDMLTLSQKIKDLSVDKIKKELEISHLESEIFRFVMDSDAHKVNGKSPAVSYVKEAYKVGGINGELLEPRVELADITAELAMLRQRFHIFEQMLDVWRTLSANERSSSL